jgi:hypothetical protein
VVKESHTAISKLILKEFGYGGDHFTEGGEDRLFQVEK